MSGSLNVTHQDRVLTRAISMVRDFLFEDKYADWGDEALAERWGFTRSMVRMRRVTTKPNMTDLLAMIAGSDLDLGITIRDPVTGREVTFFPGDNITSSLDADQETEEYTDYEDMEDRTFDGEYIPPEGEEGEQELCENCMTYSQLPGSLLCSACTEAGVEARPPDRPGVKVSAEIPQPLGEMSFSPEDLEDQEQ